MTDREAGRRFMRAEMMVAESAPMPLFDWTDRLGEFRDRVWGERLHALPLSRSAKAEGPHSSQAGRTCSFCHLQRSAASRSTTGTHGKPWVTALRVRSGRSLHLTTGLAMDKRSLPAECFNLAEQAL